MPQIVPAGEHEVVITGAVVEQVPWRVFSDNPDGDALRLTISAGAEYDVVRQDISLGNHGLLSVVAGAVLGTDRFRLVPEHLVGKSARVIIRHVENKTGSIKAVVARWVTSSKQEPLPPAFDFPARRGAEDYHRPRRGRAKWKPGAGDVMW